MMNERQQKKQQCEQYLNQPVQVQVNGQSGYSGILEYVDDENVYLMVPVDENGQYIELEQMMNQSEQQMMRQGTGERYPYYPYNPYYYQPYPYYPYPYARPFGWNRLILPLVALTALAAIY
ncbi:hypothetical protein GN156_12060 [bacterium LRH843]|nr:hypothetical protein [bacterium LRH843]